MDFSACIRLVVSGVLPEKMQVAKVIVVHKGGDTGNLANYRSICILPVFSEGLEKITHSRLISFLDEHNVLSDHQYGFRRKVYRNRLIETKINRY